MFPLVVSFVGIHFTFFTYLSFWNGSDLKIFFLILGIFVIYFCILSFTIISYIQGKNASPLKYHFSKFWMSTAVNLLNSDPNNPILLIVALIFSNPCSSASGINVLYFGFKKYQAAFSLTTVL